MTILHEHVFGQPNSGHTILLLLTWRRAYLAVSIGQTVGAKHSQFVVENVYAAANRIWKFWSSIMLMAVAGHMGGRVIVLLSGF